MNAGKCHHQNISSKSTISLGAPVRAPTPNMTPKGIGTATIVAGAHEGVKSTV
ncbi:hypothetical protein GCM10007053_08160 [Halioglobus pacificus]|uniref:Uncharacterized protein n=1 Tax=Parahalioglobus pacificus TaxID=930806 RepID=A0A919CJJ7_9GAMM|nr:hypothetical protein GCM10007053_08160 [Halioglobus pacificus]